MDPKEKSILEAMKDLCSSDEKSLGGAFAALEKNFAALDQRLRERARDVWADVQAKVRAARVRRFDPPWMRRFWSPRLPRQLRPACEHPPLVIEQAIMNARTVSEELKKTLDWIEEIRRGFDEQSAVYRAIDIEMKQSKAEFDRWFDQVKARRAAGNEGKEAQEEPAPSAATLGADAPGCPEKPK